MLRCSGSRRARNWFDPLPTLCFVALSPTSSLLRRALTYRGSGVDLDTSLISACSAAAAALHHAHLLNFFVADILELDTLAAARNFAGRDSAVVIAMYLQLRGCRAAAILRASCHSDIQVSVAGSLAQAPPPHTRQPPPLPAVSYSAI
jgi:hypothetical protein